MANTDTISESLIDTSYCFSKTQYVWTKPGCMNWVHIGMCVNRAAQ